jgi:hypothetical protein
MTHVFSQLIPFVFSYPLWILVSAILWVSGQMMQRGETFKLFSGLAIFIAAAIYVAQMH